MQYAVMAENHKGEWVMEEWVPTLAEAIAYADRLVAGEDTDFPDAEVVRVYPVGEDGCPATQFDAVYLNERPMA